MVAIVAGDGEDDDEEEDYEDEDMEDDFARREQEEEEEAKEDPYKVQSAQVASARLSKFFLGGMSEAAEELIARASPSFTADSIHAGEERDVDEDKIKVGKRIVAFVEKD